MVIIYFQSLSLTSIILSLIYIFTAFITSFCSRYYASDTYVNATFPVVFKPYNYCCCIYLNPCHEQKINEQVFPVKKLFHIRIYVA